MHITTIKVGYLNCNCYLLEKDNKILIVDPGDDYNKIEEKLLGKKVIGVLNTHSHFDHIGCIEELVKKYNINVYYYNNLEEKEYTIGPFTFKVIYTPGHSIDSITFYFEQDALMFTGDFLFFNTVGRCDLEGGDENSMKISIQKIKTYPTNTKIYPGHGYDTTLEREINNNPYF